MRCALFWYFWSHIHQNLAQTSHTCMTRSYLGFEIPSDWRSAASDTVLCESNCCVFLAELEGGLLYKDDSSEGYFVRGHRTIPMLLSN
jgi:hypothetical protein